MKCKEILDLIDGKSLREMTQSELVSVSNHAAACASCEKAFNAYRIAAQLIDTRMAESDALKPSPFFNSKVMGAIRSKGAVRDPLAAFRAWWQASFSMVAGMMVIVLALVTAAILMPAQESEAFSPTNNLYSADSVIMDQMASREFTNEQALQEIYGSKVEVKK